MVFTLKYSGAINKVSVDIISAYISRASDENGDRGRDDGKLAGGNGATSLGIVERDGENAAAAAAAAPEPAGGRTETGSSSSSSSNGSDVTGRIKKTERGRPTAVAASRRENAIDGQGRGQSDGRGTAKRSAARRTALAEMAGRESHRGHDHHHDHRDSMIDEVSRFNREMWVAGVRSPSISLLPPDRPSAVNVLQVTGWQGFYALLPPVGVPTF